MYPEEHTDTETQNILNKTLHTTMHFWQIEIIMKSRINPKCRLLGNTLKLLQRTNQNLCQMLEVFLWTVNMLGRLV